MSTSSKVDTKTKYLIYGFVRIIDIKDQIIPSSILDLCINFYYLKFKFIYIEHKYDTVPPIMSVVDLDGNKNYECKIDSIDTIQYKTHFNCGICYVSDFLLPQNELKYNYNKNNLDPKQLYDFVFVAQCFNSQSNAYIIDLDTDKIEGNKHNTYCWKLPSFKNESLAQNLLYSKKHGLISIGDAENNHNFAVLKFYDDKSDDDYDEWKWRDLSWKWPTKRCALSAAFIDDDKLICCGGSEGYREYVDIYDFTTKSMTKLSSMNEKRTYSGICIDKYNKERIYVGGGYYSSNTFEYYDFIKDSWISLANTNGQHKYWPIMWNENANIIFITSNCKVIEKIDIRENKWCNYMNNENNDYIFRNTVNSWKSRILIDNN